MLRIHFPELYRSGILPFSGICHIKYIPQFRLLAAHVQKSNALGATLHIAVHPIIPEIVLCTGRRFWSLLIDHQLLRKRILIKPCGCGQKRCPLLFAASDLCRSFLRHLHIISRFRHHLSFPPLLYSSGYKSSASYSASVISASFASSEAVHLRRFLSLPVRLFASFEALRSALSVCQGCKAS